MASIIDQAGKRKVMLGKAQIYDYKRKCSTWRERITQPAFFKNPHANSTAALNHPGRNIPVLFVYRQQFAAQADYTAFTNVKPNTSKGAEMPDGIFTWI